MRRDDTAFTEGHVSPGFEAVRDAFADNFARRGELGGACSVYCRGEKVVDLWGGVRDKASGAPWQEDTMVIVYSATKGLAAMTLALAHSRGWLDYEAPVARYWPEFAQRGKEAITVRQLLAHQAGLYALDVPLERELLADFDRFAAVLARQKPAWLPGERQAYHAVTLGFYENEILRRIDPQHRSLGQFFQDEIVARVRGFPPRIMLASLNRAPGSVLRWAARSCRTTRGASTRAILKSLPAAAWAAPAPSRALTASSPPAAASCGCAPKRCRPFPHRPLPRRAASTTNACFPTACNSRWAS